MTLSEISIKNSVFAWMLMAALILFGWIFFRQMGISQMPDVDFPVLTVEITYEGAAPEIMETNVVDVTEDALMSVQGIRSISSSSKQGQATITIEFELDRDIDVALQEVQTKITQAQRLLPKEIDPPIITKANPEDFPIMWISLSGDKTPREIMTYARDNLKNQLQTIKGVGDIILGGYIEPNIRIWIQPEKLDAYELTVKDVLDSLEREQIEVPAGRIETNKEELNVRSMGEVFSVEDLKNIIIEKRGGSPIYRTIRLGEVATVEKGLADIRRISRTNGKAGIGLGIRKQRGSNAVEVADAVLKRLEVIRKILPAGYSVQVNFDSTKFIKDAADEMKFNLVLSAILTAVVCLLFLASWGSTFNVLLAIPTSIIGSFTALYFLGFTLNTFTLLGLTLAIGIVVDDAIMVLENIVRHQEMGKKPLQAALDGSREVTPAAIAATIAIIAIFIPVVFMKGVIGKFFFQFGVTLSVTVALSLLEALTLTPMRASKLLRGGEGENRFAKWVDKSFHRMSEIYKKSLSFCLHYRWLILIFSVSLFIVSLALIPGLRKEFVPAQDQSSFIIRMQTPLGSSIVYTDEKIKQAEEYVSKQPSVERYFVAVGGFGGGEVNAGMMFITLKEPRDRPVDPTLKRRPTQEDLMTKFRDGIAKIPDLKPVVQDLSMRGFTAQRGFPVEFTVRGTDWNRLTEISKQIVEKMKQNKLFVDVDTDYLYGQKEIQIIPDRAAAAAYGVTMQDLGATINAMIGGVREGKFTENGRRNDIRVRLSEAARQKKEDILKLFVRNTHGELVPLSKIVKIEEKVTLNSITRRDRERAIGIFSNVAPGESQEKAIQEAQKISEKLLPEGYRMVLSGSAEAFKESFQSLFLVLILGIAVAYMVLGSQYNSFIHPFVVLLALPFSLSGAWVALRLFDSSLNIYSFIGVILLMGIAKKNSILLVDFTNQRRKEGMSVQDALMNACPQRLRPILMTSFATIAAAVPPALAFGPGAETRIPMAVVILGGITVSTILTLFVVPCAYSLMSRLEKKKQLV